jgi:hypothetical protein
MFGTPDDKRYPRAPPGKVIQRGAHDELIVAPSKPGRETAMPAAAAADVVRKR